LDSLISNNIIPFDKEDLSAAQQANEYIMTSLRTMEGIDLDHVREKWGEQRADLLITESSKYASRGLLDYQANRIVLTREGKLFADGIAADLFVLESEKTPVARR
jgi:oxygen-independent coproporphyrinogen-3 oxidase